MTSAYEDVLSVLERYLDGLYRCDASLLGTIFHPDARYATTTGNENLFWSMDHYLPIVAARESPESRGEARDGKVLNVGFAGPNAAMACVQSSIGNKFFTDFVSLVRLEGQWKIVAKVFDYVVKEPPRN